MADDPPGSDHFEDDLQNRSRSSKVVSAVDDQNGTPELVIADIQDDEAWISMAAEAAPTLSDWR